MQAGALNRRISVQTQSTTQDTFGQPLTAWTEAYSCWAYIDIQGSQLLYSTAEFVERVVYRITVRWTSAFTFQPNQRLVYTEATTGIVHTYQIEAVVNVKTGNRELMILAYELNGAE